jgi:hypothetical protein
MGDLSQGGRLSAFESVQKRCFACGRRFAPDRHDGALDRCVDCVKKNRPIDLVMRWIWADDDIAPSISPRIWGSLH